jgi:hypothetical protein
LRFLLPLGRPETAETLSASRNMVPWVVPIGLLVGLAWVGAFRVTWRLYGEIAAVRVIPALTIVLMECLFTGHYLLLGLTRTVDTLSQGRHLRLGGRLRVGPGEEFAQTTPSLVAGSAPREQSDMSPPSLLTPVGSLVLCLAILSQWVLITSAPAVSPWWPSPTDWRHHFNFLYPAPLYRPLLLAPMWGRWGVLLAATIGRTARRADLPVRTLCETMSPGRLLKHAILPTTLTAIYASRGGNLAIGLILSVVVFAIAYLAAVIMVRRGGGQTRQSLHATGQVAQLAFLALYRAFWPFIHG